MKNKAKNTNETGQKIKFRIVQGMMRGEVTFLMTREAHEKLVSMHEVFQRVFGDTVTQGAIVDLAINDLWDFTKQLEADAQ